eukprot:COSAG02_NODE_3060_length_7449_cov_6.145578_2_plen_516_part_00
MKKLRESKSGLMNRSVDEMSRSWDALRTSLFRDGWVEPEASLTDADGQMLVGETIYVMGYGAGKVTDFLNSRVGASKYVVTLDDGPRTETIALRRKGNDKTPFLVRSHLTTEYRRRRDNLTHRDPWTKKPGDLRRQLSTDEANTMWASFDSPERVDSQQKINMTASMDAHGNIMARPNLLDISPGDSPTLQLASGGSSTDGEDSESGSPRPRVQRLAGGGPARVRLVDTRVRPTSMMRSAPEIRSASPERPQTVVASSKHTCKLSRKDWDMLPGMGLYCDGCERLCRAYGEWFSWNCPGCDFDMCNKCLQESRDSWAVVPARGQESSGAIDINLSGDWTISMAGNSHLSAAKKVLGKSTFQVHFAVHLVCVQLSICCSLPSGLEHDAETGMVVGLHELYGEFHGKLQNGELKLILDGTEPEPEPELDGEDEDQDEFDTGSLRCEAQALPSADQTRYILVGNFTNVPRPEGATAREAPSTVAFIAHRAEAPPDAVCPPAVELAESSSESSESDEEA